MDHDQYLHWSEYYLFQEELREIIDIWSITKYSRVESDSQITSLSQQMPIGSSRDLPGAVITDVHMAPTESEAERPKRKPHCTFQWEKKRQVQYLMEGEPLYQSWTHSRPTLLPTIHSVKVYRRADTAAYVRNPMGMVDARNECHIDRHFRRMDIVQFKEEPNQAEDTAPREKLLIEEVVSINIPDLKPYEYSMMYMQRNPPLAMLGCTTTMNSDPSLGGGIIRGTVLFYDAVERLKASIDFLPQDFGYDPDHMDCKPAIYVSVKGLI